MITYGLLKLIIISGIILYILTTIAEKLNPPRNISDY